jgi:hypothetical protein
VQTKVPIIQKQQQQSYETPPQHNQFNNQQYNEQNWRG